MRALQGPGRGTPEWDNLMKELDDIGVEVQFREGAIAYGPVPSGGSPGQITIDPNSSISALRHEVMHAVDDAANGYPGMRHYMENPQARWQMEANAYDMEISAARAAGREDTAQELIANKNAEYLELFPGS